MSSKKKDTKNPILSIIYVHYNTPELLEKSIDSVKKYTTVNFEIIVIDNNSKKQISKNIHKQKNIKIVNNSKNIGFGKAVNQAASIARGKYLLLLNPDTIVKKSSISKLVLSLSKSNNIGAVSPRLVNEKEETLHSISNFPTATSALVSFTLLNKIPLLNKIGNRYWLKNFDYNSSQSVESLPGACILIKKTAFKKIQGFDENIFMYFEETDLSKRLRNTGYTLRYVHDAEVFHSGSKSIASKNKIQQMFEQSRKYILKKYHGKYKGSLVEATIRLLQPFPLLTASIFLFSLCINLYQIDNTMLFFGDIARDFLAAKNILETRTIPLLGIPSSVSWIHQGPYSVYLIALSFLTTNYNPIAPAVLYSILGSISTVLVAIAGKRMFSSKVGIISSIFFATSPLIVINSRMPYHTSPIPLIAILLIITLSKCIKKNKRLLPPVSFLFAILLSFELSNVVIFPIILGVFLLNRKNITKQDVINSSIGFSIGILPFILHDITHKFLQTVGFGLWVANRSRLFLGLTTSDVATTSQVPKALYRIYQQTSSIIFPESVVIVAVFVLAIILGVFLAVKQKSYSLKNTLLLLAWIIVPLLAFIVHTAPGPAYFPVLFPAIALLVGYTIVFFGSKNIVIYILFMLMITLNVLSLVKNDFYSITLSKKNSLPPDNYVLGFSYPVVQDIIEKISVDAQSTSYSITMGGSPSTVKTSIDPYRFVLWKNGHQEESDPKIEYTIYQNINEVPLNEKIHIHNKHIFVTKKEIRGSNN